MPFTRFVHTIHYSAYSMHGSGEKEPVNKSNLILRGCELRNTDYVEGIVLYAGRETKSMLNNSGPRYKRSELERLINWDIVWCVVLSVVGKCIANIYISTYIYMYS